MPVPDVSCVHRVLQAITIIFFTIPLIVAERPAITATPGRELQLPSRWGLFTLHWLETRAQQHGELMSQQEAALGA